jgi:hypothetical protein
VPRRRGAVVSPPLSKDDRRVSRDLTQSWQLLERSGWPASSGECTDLRAVANARALSQVVPLLGKLARRMSAGRSSKQACALGRFTRTPS